MSRRAPAAEDHKEPGVSGRWFVLLTTVVAAIVLTIGLLVAVAVLNDSNPTEQPAPLGEQAANRFFERRSD